MRTKSVSDRRRVRQTTRKHDPYINTTAVPIKHVISCNFSSHSDHFQTNTKHFSKRHKSKTYVNSTGRYNWAKMSGNAFDRQQGVSTEIDQAIQFLLPFHLPQIWPVVKLTKTWGSRMLTSYTLLWKMHINWVNLRYIALALLHSNTWVKQTLAAILLYRVIMRWCASFIFK